MEGDGDEDEAELKVKEETNIIFTIFLFQIHLLLLNSAKTPRNTIHLVQSRPEHMVGLNWNGCRAEEIEIKYTQSTSEGGEETNVKKNS